MKKDVLVGDVVLIPAAGGFAVAKVLYLSHYYKNVVLLGIAKHKVQDLNFTSAPRDFDARLYTSQVPIQEGRWSVVGNLPLTQKEVGMAKRIVAGDVWLEDQNLGPPSEQEMSSLPKMLVLGASVVERRATEIVAAITS